MGDLTYVKGLSDLQTFLEQLPTKVAKNVVRGGLRAAANVVKAEAKQNIHSVSGLLAKGLSVSTGQQGSNIVAKLSVKGKHSYLADWVEYGTSAHRIQAKIKKALAFGGHIEFAVDHPGAKPHPFMRPALDNKTSDAVVAMGNYIKDRLATKNGLDTSDVSVEADGSGDSE